MSRVASKPILLPSSVKLSEQGQQLSFDGPKGKVVFVLHDYVVLAKNENELSVSLCKKTLENLPSKVRSGRLVKSITGTMRSLLNNVVVGVSEGFEKKLLLIGVGYRAQAQGKVLNLTLGLSHPVNFAIPEGVTIETPEQTVVLVKGVDKQKVGQVAAEIRSYRPPEPYKGKGIRYSTEHVKRKETKKK
jgi:large subunit ribosomal protein L6